MHEFEQTDQTPHRRGTNQEDVMQTYNGQIQAAEIEIEDHGILTSMVRIRHDSHSGTFGGYQFDHSDGEGGHKGHVMCAEMIRRILEVVGVHRWSELKGKYIRVRKSDATHQIEEIGHITEDRWYNIREHARSLS